MSDKTAVRNMSLGGEANKNCLQVVKNLDKNFNKQSRAIRTLSILKFVF